MAYYYSPSQNGFFSDEMHGKNKPEDCVKLTDAEYNAVKGQIVKAGKNGKPIVIRAVKNA